MNPSQMGGSSGASRDVGGPAMLRWAGPSRAGPLAVRSALPCVLNGLSRAVMEQSPLAHPVPTTSSRSACAVAHRARCCPRGRPGAGPPSGVASLLAPVTVGCSSPYGARGSKCSGMGGQSGRRRRGSAPTVLGPAVQWPQLGHVAGPQAHPWAMGAYARRCSDLRFPAIGRPRQGRGLRGSGLGALWSR